MNLQPPITRLPTDLLPLLARFVPLELVFFARSCRVLWRGACAPDSSHHALVPAASAWAAWSLEHARATETRRRLALARGVLALVPPSRVAVPFAFGAVMFTVSANGARMAMFTSGIGDASMLRVVDCGTLRELCCFKEVKDETFDDPWVAVSPSGRFAASCWLYGCNVYDCDAGVRLTTIRCSPCLFTVEDSLLVIDHEAQLAFYDAPFTERRCAMAIAPRDDLMLLCQSRSFVVANSRRRIEFCVLSSANAHVLFSRSENVREAMISADETRLSGLGSRMCYVWALPSGALLRTLEFTGDVYMSLQPRMDCLAVCARIGVRTWSLYSLDGTSSSGSVTRVQPPCALSYFEVLNGASAELPCFGVLDDQATIVVRCALLRCEGGGASDKT